MIVLDTSVLLFWTLDHTKLTSKARRAIQQADQVIVSSISIWEIALKIKRHKLAIPVSMPDYVERLQHLQKLEIRAVNVQTWLDNIDLPWEHKDPADRTVVALANRLDCPLVTSDHVISDYYSKTIW